MASQTKQTSHLQLPEPVLFVVQSSRRLVIRQTRQQQRQVQV